MSDVKNKILQRYLSDDDNLGKPVRITNKYKNLAIYDEIESNFINNYETNQDKYGKDYKRIKESDIIFKEIYEEENEDELAAIREAERDIDKNKRNSIDIPNNVDQTDTNLHKKRERHDSDSEDESDANSSKSSTEKELDELLIDEDGDIIINTLNKTKPNNKELIIDFKAKKNKINSFESEGLKLKQQTIYRDEFGRKIEKHQTKEAKRKALEKLNYNQLKEWAMGFIQKEEKKREKEEFNKRKDEPFTRYDIDKEAEEEIKKRSRFGDPMKEILFNKNLNRDNINVDDSKNNFRGFYLPKCKFVGTINRFGIEPGYRWDGVDRSTGFEKRYIEAQNAIKTREQEYHKLRTEEM